jgi:hypothetical protein
MDWATAAAVVADRTPDLSDAPDPPGDDYEFWLQVEKLVNGTPSLQEASIYTEVLHPRDRLGRWMEKQHGWKDRGQDYPTMVREAVRMRLPDESEEVREHTARVVLKEIKAPKGKSAATAASARTVEGRTARTKAQDVAAELSKVVAGWEPSKKAPGGYVPERASGGERRTARVAGYVPTGGRRAQWLAKVYRMAEEAHAGQMDKQQKPYIEHVLAVADSVTNEAKPVALLHDALEDTQLTPERLKAALVEPKVTTPERAQEIVDAVRLVSHDPADSYKQYIEKIASAPGGAGELAREVKLADLQHNIGRLTPELERLRPRYEAALERLAREHRPIPQRGAPHNVAGLDEEQVRERFRALIRAAKDDGTYEHEIHWYGTAHDQIQTLAKEHKLDPHVLAAMVAATSPQLTWELKKKDTGEIVYPNLNLAVHAAEVARAYPDMPAPTLVSHLLEHGDLGGLGGSIEKAVRIYRGEDPDRVLNAPKTRSFFNNLDRPQERTTATIDLHMARATLGKREKTDYSGGTEGILAESAKGSGYSWVADRVGEVADELGLLPHQAQAAIWVSQKKISDAEDAAAKEAKKASKREPK